MKRTLILSVVSACLVGVSVNAHAQDAQPAGQSPTHKIGLIDMARVFQEYAKFSVLQEDLKAELQKNDQKAKSMAMQITKLRDEMKQFKQGSPEFIEREDNLTKLTTEFETFRKQVQREIVRKEADIYKTVYLEVVDVVRVYAEYYKYTLVLRFNTNTLESEDPQKLIQGINKQVVYYRAEDDITLSVIEYLNRKYDQAKAGTKTSIK